MIKTFDPQIYPLVLWVAIDERLENIKKTYLGLDTNTSVFDLDDEYDPDCYTCAQTIPLHNKKTKRNGVMVWMVADDEMTPGTVAHECLHVLDFYCQYLGIPEGSFNDDEPRAYLLGWFVKNVYDTVTKYKNKNHE